MRLSDAIFIDDIHYYSDQKALNRPLLFTRYMPLKPARFKYKSRAALGIIQKRKLRYIPLNCESVNNKLPKRCCFKQEIRPSGLVYNCLCIHQFFIYIFVACAGIWSKNSAAPPMKGSK